MVNQPAINTDSIPASSSGEAGIVVPQWRLAAPWLSIVETPDGTGPVIHQVMSQVARNHMGEPNPEFSKNAVLGWTAHIERALPSRGAAIVPPLVWLYATKIAPEMLTGTINTGNWAAEMYERWQKSGLANKWDTSIGRWAESKGLVRAPDSLRTPPERVISNVTRDIPLYWHSVLNGAIPVVDLPLICFWVSDPITAHWMRGQFEKGLLSAYARPLLPWVSALSFGWLPPTLALRSLQVWTRITTEVFW